MIDFKEKILTELRKVDRVGMGLLIHWLEESDFFTAPCSKDHHLNVAGGLAEHSWNVFVLFKEKNERYKLGLSDDTVRLCSLLHDLCKVGFYVKNPSYDGSVSPWLYNDKFPIGHGEKSVIMYRR